MKNLGTETGTINSKYIFRASPKVNLSETQPNTCSTTKTYSIICGNQALNNSY